MFFKFPKEGFVVLLNVLVCVWSQLETTISPSQQCNLTIREGQGAIISPNFPSPYDPDMNCQWQITVEQDRTILLFFSFFDIETSPNCAYDSVSVYNGPTMSHPLLGRYCGAFRPSNVRTTANRMLVTFKSDDSKQKFGFIASFRSMEHQIAGQNSCGGLLTDDSGSFHSVNFPKLNYPNSLTCTWHIRTDEDRKIILKFDTVSLETSTNCKYDSLSVFSGWSNNEDTRFLGRFCEKENTPGEIVSVGNEMFVTFATDSSGNDAGFLASYATRLISSTSTKKPVTTASPSSVCPETVYLTSASGVITSPGYKQTEGYQPNLRCSWQIDTSPGTKIVLRFENFQLENDQDCIFDYVSLYSGRRETSEKLIGRYCGTMRSRELRSVGNHMRILFVTDSGGNSAGFRASYTTDSLPQSEYHTSAMVTSNTSPQPTSGFVKFTTLTTTASSTDATNLTTTSIPNLCSQSCPSSPPHLPTKVCSSFFVASVKIIRMQTLPSGTLRTRVSLLKMLKLTNKAITMKRKAKLWLDIPCPNCFTTLKRRSKYIILGSELTQSGGQLSLTDYIEKFSKKTQKYLKKAIRRCRRSRSLEKQKKRRRRKRRKTN